MTVVRKLVRVVAPLASVALLGATFASADARTSASTSASTARSHFTWKDVSTGIDEQYRGLDPVNRRVAWVSGENGSVLRTTNGGRTWKDVSPAGTVGMAFRDVEAKNARHASVLAIGTGTDSRIYTTGSGGRHWRLAFVNHAPNAFYDCMAFWPGHRNGLAVSDPVDGKFRLVRTRDGGHSWHRVPSAGMPPAVDGEFAFAASGTCLVTAGRSTVYLASGGAASRIFHSADRGRRWRVTDGPIPAGPTSGVYSIAFKSPRVGIAVGGDFTAPDAATPSGLTRTHGRTWMVRGSTLGYRSGVAWVSKWSAVAVAVGPTGTDMTPDAGGHWLGVDDTPYDSVQCTRDRSCWLSGPHGAVGRATWHR